MKKPFDVNLYFVFALRRGTRRTDPNNGVRIANGVPYSEFRGVLVVEFDGRSITIHEKGPERVSEELIAAYMMRCSRRLGKPRDIQRDVCVNNPACNQRRVRRCSSVLVAPQRRLHLV